MDHLGLTKKDTPVHHHNFAALMERHHLHPCVRHCLFLARVLPFLMISSFFFGGLYVYLSAVIFHGYQLLGRVLVLVPFTPLFVVAYWAYLRTVFATHRPIPEEFSLPDSMREDFTSDSAINEMLERLIKSRNLPIYTRNIEGNRVRFCLQCQVLKPDRAHHCSVCNMCTRKMDHHCPMVSNCVAFDNYKFFVQFLGYTVTLTLYAALTSLPQLFKFWSKEDFPTEHFMIFFLIVFCFVIAVSLSFLLSYHVYLVLRNQTTLEASRAPIFKDTKLNEHLFDLGSYRNFCAVFGDNKLLWFLPLMTSLGEGLYFDLKLKPAHYGKSPDWCVV